MADNQQYANKPGYNPEGFPISSLYSYARGVVQVGGLSSLLYVGDIYGYQVVNKGSGDITLSFVDGSSFIILAADLTAMGDAAYIQISEHLSSISVSDSSTKIKVYL